MSAYKKLESLFKEIGDIEGAIGMLYWDSAAVMPKGGAEARSDQIATLSTISHKKLIAKETNDLLIQAKEEIANLDKWQKPNLALMEHRYKHASAVETRLVEALSKAGSKCEAVWRSARAANDFASYEPLQQKVLGLVRESAAAKAEAFGCSKYDALLDQFDAGRKSEEIDVIFSQLHAFLPNFIRQVLEKQQSRPAIYTLKPPFPIDKQKDLGVFFMRALGFDFDHGRLDISHHPFCGGVADDVRITTRYDEQDFTSSLMGILHESGHALYEQGLPKDYRGQPVGNALGMSIHESQSLLIEMQVCRSKEFLTYATPIIAKTFGQDVSSNDLISIYNHVEAGFIRVDADEVTYPAHVMIRYELEKQLIDGTMQIKDIPEKWNAMIKEFLGIDVPDYNHGCMQDIHWTDGSFGYFPTYTLGAMHAAQFYHQAKLDNPQIPQLIQEGDFSALLGWLREKIHSKGSKLSANELLSEVTGNSLDVDIYKEHLKSRYL